MAQIEKRIPLEEFTGNVESFFERVVHEHTTVVVENEKGERAILKPVGTRKVKRRKKTEADYAAFRASFGGWKDVDTKQLKRDIDEARNRDIRPQLDL